MAMRCYYFRFFKYNSQPLIYVAMSFLGVLVFPTQILASEFSTTYDITYTVDPKGMTTANQKVILKNNFDHLQATKYSLIIGSTKLSQIRAQDNFGTLVPKIESLENSTEVQLEFDQAITGKDKQRDMTISYQTPDFATVKGKVLEVGFPLLSNSQDLDHYTVTLRIPLKFGEPSHLSPKPTRTSQSGDHQVIYFSEESLAKQSNITAKFGTEQIMEMTLRYTLENPNAMRGRTEIALPPDTNYQQVLYQRLSPAPSQVKVDQDGNWLAQYIVEPKANLEIEAQATVKLSLRPNHTHKKILTDEEQKLNTKIDQYWPVTNDQVVKLAKELKTPRGVYDYLVQNFIYDYGRLSKDTTRFGAERALANPHNAICMEFTDTFVTLTRALGVPAREQNGFGYTENERLRPLSLEQDILHSWPAYWDSKAQQWIQVDPTWGNTTGGLDFFDTFDLDHITFVIHGIESTYPITAGSYKTEMTDGKDVEVSFGETFEPKEQVGLTFEPMPSGITGLPNRGSLKIVNSGNTALYELPVKLELKENEKVVWQETQKLETLPPFAYQELDLLYYPSWQHAGGDYVLSAQALDQKEDTSFKLSQPIKPIWIAWALGGGGGAGLWILGYWGTSKWQNRKRQKLTVLEGEVIENLDKPLSQL